MCCQCMLPVYAAKTVHQQTHWGSGTGDFGKRDQLGMLTAVEEDLCSFETARRLKSLSLGKAGLIPQLGLVGGWGLSISGGSRRISEAKS